MSLTTRLATAALAFAVTAGTGGCGLFYQPPPPNRASAAAKAACRSRTDQTFAQQNRYLLSERDTRDSPFSTSGTTGITSAGLSQRYAYDNLYDNCIGANAPDAGNGAAFTPGGTTTLTPGDSP